MGREEKKWPNSIVSVVECGDQTYLPNFGSLSKKKFLGVLLSPLFIIVKKRIIALYLQLTLYIHMLLLLTLLLSHVHVPVPAS